MLYHYMHFYVMMQKTREIDWCPKYEVSERFGSFKLSNSNAVAVCMAREYWKMHAKAESCIADTALSPRNAFDPMQNSASPRPALDGMHYSGFVQYRQCSSRPSRAFSNTPSPYAQQYYNTVLVW